MLPLHTDPIRDDPAVPLAVRWNRIARAGPLALQRDALGPGLASGSNLRADPGKPGQSPETSFAIAISRETVIGSAASRNSAMDACSPWNFTAASSV